MLLSDACSFTDIIFEPVGIVCRHFTSNCLGSVSEYCIFAGRSWSCLRLKTKGGVCGPAMKY